MPFALLCLTACGGGSGDVSVAGGQGPDPVLVEVSIAYVKRPLPVDGQGMLVTDDVTELLNFDAGTVGADLYVRDRASPSATEVNVTAAETQGLGDVRDVTPSFDGTRFLFAVRGPFDPNLNDDEQPTWNIWEYEVPTQTLRRIIASDIIAEGGHDLAPAYLPDGRIIFSSSRQRTAGAVLLDEGKPQFSALEEDRNDFAFVLHVMDDDGSNITQVSYNQSHDLYPTVLDNGQVAFSRWDNAGNNDSIHLYRMNPDGTSLELLYGAESHDTGTNGAEVEFVEAQQMPDGELLNILRPRVTDTFGGDLVMIDTADYAENTQPTAVNAGVLTGPAQVRAVINDVHTDGTISPGGSFSSATPMHDGSDRLVVSWSQCRLLEGQQIVPCTPERLADPNAVPAPPLYGLWVYNTDDDTQLPVVPPEEGIMYTDIAIGEPRTPPPVILDIEFSGAGDAALLAEGAGIINIRSVYDVDGVDTAVPDIPTLADPAFTPVDARPIRFLRVVKAVSIPDDDLVDLDNTAFGRSTANGMREIIGYVPVDPDGSVQVKVPANVALQISLLDARGRRVSPRHNAWLQLRPGEVRTCNGCHVPDTGVSHGRAEAFDPVYPGSPDTGQPFPNTLEPAFADFGETMAEARARLSCATDCASITPSLDVTFTDIWTDPAVATPGADLMYLYADLDTPPPATPGCQTSWSPACRTIIHYEDHIHPIWSVPRLAADGVTDATCTTCHRRVDDMGAPMVPQGQLDLSDGVDPVVMDHLISYRELLFGDNAQEVNNGILQDRLVPGPIDPVTGLPTQVPIPVAPSMSTAGANASAQFFDRFDSDPTHMGLLTDAELRLISEWLDIGGQYFNNPFDVPIN
ncbi:MAG: PD40 domain-containing protein [Chromatiales bacterium]|nr:MAG: PD40 domain-containing protein [Chromatiales bacterium]